MSSDQRVVMEEIRQRLLMFSACVEAAKLRDIIATPGVEPVDVSTPFLRGLVERLALEVDPDADLAKWPEALAFQIELTRAVIKELRLAAPSAPVPMDIGWLVENGKNDERRQYRTWKDGFPAWTADHNEATRYCRRIDAERAHQEDEEAGRIVQHAWVPAVSASVAPVQATECDECHGDPSLCDIHDCGDAHKTTAKMQAPVQAAPVAYHDKDQPEGIAWCPGYPEKLNDISPLYTQAPVQAVPDAVTDAMVDAFISFADKTGDLSHPEVPYMGTINGDSEDQWRRRVVRAALSKALAAAPQPPKENGE